MGSKSLPEQLQIALQNHIEQSDLRNDEDMADLLVRLGSLSEKVKAAKEKVLLKRHRDTACLRQKP